MQKKEQQKQSKSPERSTQNHLESAVNVLERVGHINIAVVFVQLRAGAELGERYGVDPAIFYIEKDWWDRYVGHSGTFQSMAKDFDTNYRKYVEKIINNIEKGADYKQKLDVEAEAVVDPYSVADKTYSENLADTEHTTTISSKIILEAQTHVIGFAELIKSGYKVDLSKDPVDFIKNLIDYVLLQNNIKTTEAERVTLFDNLSQIFYDRQRSLDNDPPPFISDDGISPSESGASGPSVSSLDAEDVDLLHDENIIVPLGSKDTNENSITVNEETEGTEYDTTAQDDIASDNSIGPDHQEGELSADITAQRVSHDPEEERAALITRTDDATVSTSMSVKSAKEEETVEDVQAADEVKNGDPQELTTPEERTYTQEDAYSFLTTDLKTDDEGEIIELKSESELSGLDTKLLKNTDTNTDEGATQSGFIVEPVQGFTRTETDTSLSGSDEPALAQQYNQRHIPGVVQQSTEPGYANPGFDIAKTKAIFIRCMADGTELGDPVLNKRLRQYARRHGIPIVLIEVPQKTVPPELVSKMLPES